MPQQLPIPTDIIDTYHLIGALLLDLDDLTAEECKDWQKEIRLAKLDADNGRPRNWQSLRDMLNSILADGGYPPLFTQFETN
jgi:hypothetical protein